MTQSSTLFTSTSFISKKSNFSQLFHKTQKTLKISKIHYKKPNFNHQYIYIFLLAIITLFLTAINNFRYNVSYNIYFIPFFFLLLAIFFNLIEKKNKLIFSTVISIFIIFNFAKNLSNYQSYLYKASNLQNVCVTKSIRDFYHHWARNFNDDFFKKVCLNKNLLFK